MLANNENLGNVKIFISDSRLIYKIYPYGFFNQEYKHKKRSKKELECTEQKKMLNEYAKKMDVLGYGLCNDWQYFFTGTIDPRVYNAASFDSVSKLISECFYRIRKKYGKSVKYMFILEQHKNGNYHAHGFCNVPYEVINPNPLYINREGKRVRPSKSKFIQYGIDQNYYNLGLNTISPVINKDSVSDYCVKYMIKMMSHGSKFAQSVFKSKGLKTFEIQHGSFIGDDFKSCLGIYDYDNNKYGIENIYQYEVKSYGDNIKEITLHLK